MSAMQSCRLFKVFRDWLAMKYGMPDPNHIALLYRSNLAGVASDYDFLEIMRSGRRIVLGDLIPLNCNSVLSGLPDRDLRCVRGGVPSVGQRSGMHFLAVVRYWGQRNFPFFSSLRQKGTYGHRRKMFLAVAGLLSITNGPVEAQSSQLKSVIGISVNNVLKRLEELPARTGRGIVWAVDFSPDRKKIAIGNNFQVDVWDWEKKHLEVTIPLPEGVPPELNANGVKFSPDGSLLAILVSGAAQRVVVRVLNTRDWTVAKDIRDDKSVRVVGMAFTPDGRNLVTANDLVGNSGDSITAYAIDGWKAEWGLNLGLLSPIAIAMSPDGKRVAIDGEFTTRPDPGITDMMERIRQTKDVWQVHLIDLSTRSVARTFITAACGQMAWTADSSRLAVVGNTSFEIYDAATGERILRSSEPGNGHQNVRLTPDGRFFINSDANGSGTGHGLQIWDATRRKLLAEVPGNTWSLAVSFDSSLLATGDDGHVTVWRFKPSKE